MSSDGGRAARLDEAERHRRMVTAYNESRDQRDRLVRDLYRLDGMPQAEIARRVGLTQGQVSRVLNNAESKRQGLVVKAPGRPARG